MSGIVIVDTSVFLNVLDVPGFNQDREAALSLFNDYIEAGANLLLPIAAIFEAGNHIAQLADGQQRRRYAEAFKDRVREALAGQAPWTPIRLPDDRELAGLARRFPGFRHARRRHGRSLHRQGMGTNLRTASRSPGHHLVARPTPGRIRPQTVRWSSTDAAERLVTGQEPWLAVVGCPA